MKSHLDFLNKNTLRQYPIVGTSRGIAIQGYSLPTALLSDCKVTTILSHGDVYISKVIKTGNYLSVELSSNTANVVIGSFNTIMGHYTTSLIMTSLPFVSGHLTLGNILLTQNDVQPVYHFTYAQGRLEPTAVLEVTPPAVSSITIIGIPVTGLIDLELTNLENGSATEIELNVIDSTQVTSISDFTTLTDSCPLGSIKFINDVPPDNNGNINIYGINPVTFVFSAGLGVLSSPTFALEDYCLINRNNIPPINVSDVYATITADPSIEYLTWPQYTP